MHTHYQERSKINVDKIRPYGFGYALCPLRVRDSPTATALSFMGYVRIDISIIVDFKNFAGPFGAVSAFASAALFWYNTSIGEFRELVQVNTPGQRELHKFQVHNSPRFCKRSSNQSVGHASQNVYTGGATTTNGKSKESLSKGAPVASLLLVAHGPVCALSKEGVQWA